ncbi:1-acyl-sn-glycerol-3-phosphate acyltransferase [Nakamurella panacisegetis]|uniref:1-acyl-sn-glycerol-3-phosphate acyltransferase n=1 Tax=Nakamurella panacisegetis TaxID=1090615 RepID=A0A1H0LLN7_9ACTN|nr:1-acyl-sn-glycerol-3-phosphate acyltransferase [Nakamurella panacisegetis]
MYRGVMVLTWPLVRWWGRLMVEGIEALPRSGPVLIFANHDSAWDPLVIAGAARHRQICALAKATLWRHRAIGWVLDGMGQIPIRRGEHDALAISTAADVLTAGGCVGIFPEGTVSRGRTLRARSGAGRLALDVPTATIVCAAVTGSADIVRWPTRPRLRVHFFRPAGGQPHPGENAHDVSARILAELRADAPVVATGRHPGVGRSDSRAAAPSSRSEE